MAAVISLQLAVVLAVNHPSPRFSPGMISFIATCRFCVSALLLSSLFLFCDFQERGTNRRPCWCPYFSKSKLTSLYIALDDPRKDRGSSNRISFETKGPTSVSRRQTRH